MNSGVKVDSAGFQTSGLVTREVTYESIYIDTSKLWLLAGKLGQWMGSFWSLIKGAAVTKPSYSFEKTKPSTLAPEPVKVVQEGFTVVSSENLTAFDSRSVHTSEAEAHDYLDRLIAENPNLASEVQVIANFEVKEAA